MTSIKKLLVANRSEIAIRVFRAASELEIPTVAIYTYEDRYSLHRYKADEAYQIGKDNDPLKPYLDIEEIIRVAKREGVDAIHPGYGFLSENVTFAQRCREEGIIFVGPDPEIMEQLGDKMKAKNIAVSCQVPIIESSKDDMDTIEKAVEAANKIGYPVMVKATMGGGGRGMRVVRNEEQLRKSFPEARRESKTAFGDDTVFIEKYVENPKHIEVQILGDKFGNIVHLFERDCSVQRRFQKVVEIAPAPNLRPETSRALHGYALRIARKMGYNNAGTVEFLVDKEENIYFIEVNPRIQVEHTVTEEVTGIDIVRTQILIAAGKPLTSKGIYINSQDDVTCNGFAIQCRITTEDPQDDFKPDYGKLIAYRNAGGLNIRLDEGNAFKGSIISPFFDSLLVKVTASGRTLEGASKRLQRALREFRVRGVKTNIEFLINVLRHSDFEQGRITVNFIGDNPDLLKFPPKRDRATRMMRYIANVSINGHPSVQSKDRQSTKRDFLNPIVPDYDPHNIPTNGTKQMLTEMGAEKFAQWLKNEPVTKITDTTFRDAHQSLLATRFRTNDMLKVAESYARHHPQTFSMEVWGGATFDVALRFLKECPWKRLAQIRKAVPNILLQMLLRGSNAVGYTAYPDNLVERFIEKSWETGVDIFRIFDSLNWVENMKVSINTVRERTGGLAEVCLGYTGDVLTSKKYDLQYYLDLARQVEDAGAHIIAIKDMAGLLKPYAAELLISELKKVVNTPIHLHTHDTSSAQLTTYLKAIEAGVDVVDVAMASMSGLTSQPNFNTLCAILENSPHDPKFDLASLNEFSNYWERVRAYYYPFESGLKTGTAEVYDHEIPGGQYSNLGPQAQSLGLGDKMEAIKKTYSDVNDLFGDIVKVTPSSKVVGDLALYMVSNGYTKADILEKGQNIDFPQSVKSFFRGELGQPYQGFPKKMQKLVLKDEKPMTERANAQLQPVDFEKEFALFQKKYHDRMTELDFISYKLYPRVFQDYFDHYHLYGNVSVLPTPVYFYGLRQQEEVIVAIDRGKTLLIKLIYFGDADEEGYRNVYFKLNGQERTVRVKDNSVEVHKVMHRKADKNKTGEIGTPLQGLLSKIFVKVGDKVKAGTPLFVIEAMKMETTVTSVQAGTVQHIQLSENTLVAADDLVLVVG